MKVLEESLLEKLKNCISEIATKHDMESLHEDLHELALG